MLKRLGNKKVEKRDVHEQIGKHKDRKKRCSQKIEKIKLQERDGKIGKH